MNITIINLSQGKYLPPRHGAKWIYIGRSRLQEVPGFGNPFTHLKKKTLAEIQVPTRADAIQAYKDWLDGTAWTGVEPEQRLWIRDQIAKLGKAGLDLMLGCWCVPEPCHGEVLRDIILEVHRRYEEVTHGPGH